MILGSDFIHEHSLSYDSVAQRLFYEPTAATQWEEGSLILTEAVTIEPGCQQPVRVRAQAAPGENLVGPALVVADIDCTGAPLAGPATMVNISDRGVASVVVCNVLDISVTLPRNTYIGSVLKRTEEQCTQIHLDLNQAPLTSPPTNLECDPDKATFIRETMTPQLAHLSPILQERYMAVILRNHDVFSRDKFDIGRTDILSHSVQLKDEEPVYVKQFRIPDTHRSVLVEHLNNWLKLGVVSPSKSHYNSPIFCVPKKDGTLRPVLDFRAINEKSFVDKYSQREVQDCIDEIGRAQSTIFSSLDLTAGFWQLPLEPGSRPFTCFTIPGLGSFEWNMTPMGLLGSPASFGRMMDFIMRFLSVITYQDDILVHSKTHDHHIAELQKVLDRLRAHGLKLNVKKCFFAQIEVSYLGFTLTPGGILPGKDKSAALKDFKPPASVRQVREFVGLCNYFRQSVLNFSELSRPLTALTQKACTWKGGDLPPAALLAFHSLKEALTNPPVLAYPNPELDYHLMVDASICSEGIPGGLGAVLIQVDKDDVPHAIGFASRGLSKFERNYTAYLLELQAACFGISHFDVYLRGRHFTLHTDHRPLETLSKVHVRTLNRLQQLMLDYNFTIAYKPGKDNVVSDFLSRNPVSAVGVNMGKLQSLQAADPLIAKLLTSLSLPSGGDTPVFRKLRPFLVLRNNILFHKKAEYIRIFVPKVLQDQILQSAHNSLAGGHMGIFKTKNRVLARYFWPSLDTDLKAHIKCCIICQQTRPFHRRTREPLVPLPQPPAPNHRLHIDLFGPLNVSASGKKFVMVMTDAFTKYVELAALPDKTAVSVAEALMSFWFTRYTVPKEILSDNGREFCNELMKELCSVLGILHKTTSPYHPECNASAEVFNRTMKYYLQAAISSPYLEWEQYLPALRLCYNTSVSKATLATPFSLVFGMEPNMPYFDLEPSFSYNESPRDALVQLQYARKHALAQNLIYKKEYARQHDAGNALTKASLSLEDQIMVACMPKQKFRNAKLHPVFEGPFPIVKLSPPNIYFQYGKKVRVTHLNRVKKASVALQSLAPDQILCTPRVSADPLTFDVEHELPGEDVIISDDLVGAELPPPNMQTEYLSDSADENDEFFDLPAAADEDDFVPVDIPELSVSPSPAATGTRSESDPLGGKSKSSAKLKDTTCLADLLLFPGPATRSRVRVPDIPLPPFKLGGRVLEKFLTKKDPPK
jgi:transposase InsO family protein